LASSIAERPVDVRPSLDDVAWSDGRTIYVADPGDGARCEGEVVVQAGLMRRGSLAPAVVRRLRGRASVTRRYLALEGWAVASELAVELPVVVAAYGPGPPSVSPSPAASLEQAQRANAFEPHPWFGAIRPGAVLPAASGTDAEADDPVPLPDSFTDAGLGELDDDEESDDPGTIMRLLSSPIGSGNPLSRLFNRLLGMGRREGEGTPGGEIRTGTARAAARHRRGMAFGRLEAVDATTPVAAAPGLLAYPEWDMRAGRLRPAWCLVREVVPERSAATSPPADAEVERAVARIGLARQRVRRRPEGHDLDLDAAVEAIVTTRTDGWPSRGVYVDNVETRRELGVLVLLDASGSTGEAADHRSVFQRAAGIAGSLVREFGDVGARTAFYGFQSRGREHVHLLRFKAFDEPSSGAVWGRAAGVAPGAYTRMGAAVRHSVRVLADESGTSQRLLIVLTDGFPYDDGYEGAYAEADVRRALAEGRSVGVGSVCLSLGSTGASMLGRVFGSAVHASVADQRELRFVLPRLCRVALRGAATAQHRARAVDRLAGAAASARLTG
jgi:hypothetical protein